MSDKPSSGIVTDTQRGAVFDATWGSMHVKWTDAFDTLPVTVEMWALPRRSGELLATCIDRDGKSIKWAIAVGLQGELAACFTCGDRTRFVWNSREIRDGRWHYLALAYDGQVAQLWIDGKQSPQLDNEQTALQPGFPPGLLLGTSLGTPPARNGRALVQEIRISRGIRDIHPTTERLNVDSETIGLWRFDAATPDGQVPSSASPDHTEMTGQLEAMPDGCLDDFDRQSFAPTHSPFDAPAQLIELKPGISKHHQPLGSMVLDGLWEMAEGGDPAERLCKPWLDAIPAVVPGSVHSTLEKAARIPDPKFGRNDAIAREQSFKTWWFKRSFSRPTEGTARLVFDGVAIRCHVWLNRKFLGSHDGMFGGPEFDITSDLQEQNEVVVCIDPAPFALGGAPLRDNAGWKSTVVFNNVYGWHYSNIPSLGIWRSVRIKPAQPIEIIDPFVATEDATAGIINLRVDLRSASDRLSGRLIGMIVGENFVDRPHVFELPVESATAEQSLHLKIQIPNPRPWWPNGMGEPNLYRLVLQCIPEKGLRAARYETTFGLRTIEMAPLPEGRSPHLYNWTFVVNGKPMFIKGTGWCTMDSSMDFRRERYEHFLRLARNEHCQMVRAWGSGMPETDDFYDLCDRLGIMVMQEWPTAWNSHEVQPYAVLEETVRLNTLRLRNHPSLVMWGGGNESSHPFGKAIDMMGRFAIELDGTRPFHRGEPWGGSQHSYPAWWSRRHLTSHLRIEAPFIGEFGHASMPVMESILRYLPQDEKEQWPPLDGGSFLHHTPLFNRVDDIGRLNQSATLFSDCTTMDRFVLATHLAQIIALRHPLERARVRWPDCTGALLYKLNDNYPAASWSTVDWYGAIKPAHWFVQDAFAPVHACIIIDELNNHGASLKLPVFLLDDTEKLAGTQWEVIVRAYNEQLQLVQQVQFSGNGVQGTVSRLGDLELTAEQASATPLLAVAEVRCDGTVIDRTFYFVNFEARKNCLFELPQTTLTVRRSGKRITVSNTGHVPAVGVNIERPGYADTFDIDDNWIWLDSGESIELNPNAQDGLTVMALNVERIWIHNE